MRNSVKFCRRGSSRGFSSNRSGGLRSGGNFQSSRGRSSRGGQRGRGGRGRGRGRDRRQPPSKEDLDKELDSYIEHVGSCLTSICSFWLFSVVFCQHKKLN